MKRANQLIREILVNVVLMVAIILAAFLITDFLLARLGISVSGTTRAVILQFAIWAAFIIAVGRFIKGIKKYRNDRSPTAK